MAPPLGGGMQLREAMSAFDPRGELLAMLSGAGRVKTWDVSTGQLHAEFVYQVGGGDGSLLESNGALAMDYTVLAWGEISVDTAKSKKKKEGKIGHKQRLLAVGTSSGHVLAWDSALGELKWRTNDCNAGGVTSLAFSPTGGVLYAGGADGQVCELDCTSGRILERFRGSKHAISSVAVSPDGGQLLAASSEIKLFDLASKKSQRKFAGHPTSVKALIFAAKGSYAVSSSLGDRHIAVWNCVASKTEDTSGVVAALGMEDPGVAVDWGGEGEESDALKLLAVSENGEVYVWQADSASKLAKSKPIRIRVSNPSQGKGGKKTGDIILAARFVRGADGHQSSAVLVAKGSVAKPEFERVELSDKDGEVLLKAAEDGLLLKTPRAKTSEPGPKEKGMITVLGPETAGEVVMQQPQLAVEDLKARKQAKEKKRRRASGGDVEMTAGQAKVEDDDTVQPEAGDVMNVDNGEQTLEEMLASMGLDVSGQVRDTQKGQLAENIKAESLQVLISQALHSEDNELIERGLNVINDKVVTSTVRRLTSIEAGKLLSLLVAKLHAKPNRDNLVMWIRSILLYHAAHLMSAPNVQVALSSLQQLIGARLSVFQPMLALLGRLDLVLSQIGQLGGAVEQADGPDTPAIVYEEEETDDEEEDVEDAMVDESEGFSDEDEEWDSQDDTPAKGKEDNHAADDIYGESDEDLESLSS
ncbi:hypothetical protein CBR_g57080 [Chara braunii]|uniref:Small-subunit processome Utp12 domain-containing protein n=1 Tax=Chara braunii TaxID=69332 RepID=A0A388K843_CHABU|nr:hypothetical protein CBR_g57080 [Chara braunii]|eukprot:GBG66201.1 hypothetical protein CBR_g57080 [Chara braunii]